MLGSAVCQYHDEPISAESVGFRLDTVVQDTDTGLIVITATARLPPDTAAYVYFPKQAGNIVNLSENACSSSTDICCLRNFDSQYLVSGNFGAIQDTYCPEGTLNWGELETSDTAFPKQLQADIALNTVPDSVSDGVGQPTVTDIGDGRYTLRYEFAHSIIKDNLAIETTSSTNAAMKTYRSMIGVLFIRTSDTSHSVTIHAAQGEFEYTKTTGLFVSVATEQQRLALDDITFTFHNAIDETSNAHSFVQVTVDYDTNVFASYEIVPTTLRYGAADSYKNVGTDEWTTPVCPATAPLWDTSCSDSWTYCVYDSVTSQFPFLGLADILPGRNVYLQFTVRSTLTGGTNTVLSHILVEMAADSITPLESCQSTTFEPQDISDLVDVSATIGTGTNTLTLADTTSDAVNNVQQLSNQGNSYSDALQLIELDAQDFLAKDYASNYQLVIDDGIVYNFLDTWGGTSNSPNSGYADVLEAIKTGDGFTVTEDGDLNRFVMTPVAGKATADTCANLADIVAETSNFETFSKCVYRHAIKDNVVQDNSLNSVHVLRSSEVVAETLAVLKTTNAQPWLKQNVYGNGDEDATTAFASDYLLQHCKNDGAEPTNGYMCIWVDPGFKWLSAPLNLQNNPYTLADRTITVLLVSIRDSNNNAVARRLLSFDSEDAMQKARRTLAKKRTLETIKTAMDASMSIKHHLPKRRVAPVPHVAPVRHLLQTASKEEEYMEDLENHFAGTGLAVMNSNVDPYVNMAILTGHLSKRWQYLRVSMPLGSAPRDVLIHNVRAKLAASSGNARLLGGSLIPVDFLFGDQANGRRLLETSSSVTATVILSGAAYGEMNKLLKEYLTCLFDELKDVTVSYDNATAVTEIKKCDDNLTAYEGKRDVVVATTSQCGNGSVVLSANCTKVVSLQYYNYPKIAVDPSIDSTTKPVLQFELGISGELDENSAQDDELISNIRWSFSEALGVNMDRIVVEIKSRQTTSRRLLATEYYVVVSVYADDRENTIWPPPNTQVNTLYQNKRGTALTNLHERSSMLFTASDPEPTPVAPPSPSSFPYRVQISGHYPTTRTELLEMDSIQLAATVKSLVPVSLSVPMNDVIVHNVRLVSPNVHFEISVSRQTSKEACTLRKTATDMRASMATSITEWLRTLGYLKSSEKVTLTDVEQKDRDNNNVSCGSWTLTIILISVGVLVLGGLVVWYVMTPKASASTAPAAGLPQRSLIEGNVIYTRIV